MIAEAKSYYLSKDGDDTNPGTKEKPWRTLAKLNTADLEPGETVYLEGGTTFPGTLVLDSLDSGAAGKLVTITSYGTGVATLDGGNKEAALISSNYFHIKAINAKGAGRKEGNSANGIEVRKSNQGTLEQVVIEGFQHSGLLLYSCHNMKAIKVTARNNGYSGLFITGDHTIRNGVYQFPDQDKDRSRNITLKDCIAENNPGDPSVLDNHSGNGILVEFTKGILIDHCIATNNGWDMPRPANGPIGIWAASSDSVIIQNSISYRNKIPNGAHDGGGFAFDGGTTNSILQYCLSYENEGPGFGLYQWAGAREWNNNIIRYSISINDVVNGQTPENPIKYGSISTWNGGAGSTQFKNGQVYHNLIVNSTSPTLYFIPSSDKENFGFYNNIFIGKNELIDGSAEGSRFLGNTYWNLNGSAVTFQGYSSLKEWAEATGQEKLEGKLVGLFVDPQLTGPLTATLTDPYQLGTLAGFRLQPNSPLKDKGLDLQRLFKLTVPSLDFYGNPAFKGLAPEPGVHELD
ncbi:right-handed parallel beta-helix repeat-containing protein [Rufibacter soli]